MTVGYFKGGPAFNVIPDTAEMGGTVRTFTPENRDLLEKRIGEIATGIGEALGAKIDYTYTRGYPATTNDPAMTELVREEAARVVGEDGVENPALMMGAEDFSLLPGGGSRRLLVRGQQQPGARPDLGPSPPEVRPSTRP